ncbi:MAG: ABC transporter substrate-binding protein [Haloarculaceae archaeon]
MADESKRYSDLIDRRRFVELTGVAGAAALAGCGGGGNETDTPTETSGGGGGGEATDTPTESSGGGGNETDTPTESGTQVYDVAFHDFTNQVPANLQFNANNPSNYSQIAYQDLFDNFVNFDYSSGEFVPYAIQDWNMSGTTFEMTLRDGLTWQNGDPVTAEDFVTQLRLGLTVGAAYKSYTDSFEAADDSTVVMHLSKETNPTIVKHRVFNNWIYAKSSKYGDYVDSGDELAQFADTDPIASSVWKLSDAGQQEMVLQRRESGHPDISNVNFQRKVYTFLDGNQAAQQALISGDLDAAWSLFSPPRVVANYPDRVVEARPPAKWGMGLIPNHEDQHMGKRKVRQAIMEAMNREQVIQNAGPRTKATPPIATGIATDDQQRWLGDSMSDYTGYHKGSSAVDAADQLMSSAGYSKDGGTYKDSNGNAVSLPIITPAGWSDWVSATQTIADQLSSAGFDAAVDARSFGSIAGNVWPNGDNFRITAGYWLPGGARTSFPYFPLEFELVQSGDTFDYRYPGHNGEDITVPGMNGGQMTLNPQDKTNTLATTLNSDQSQQIVRDLAWVANKDLPMLPVAEKLEQSFITNDEWNTPDEGSDKLMIKWPPSWLPKQGELTYKGN